MTASEARVLAARVWVAEGAIEARPKLRNLAASLFDVGETAAGHAIRLELIQLETETPYGAPRG